jgi:hypothetical protein
MEIGAGDVYLRPAMRAFAPGPRGRRHVERATDHRAGHVSPQREHRAVGVTAKPARARALVVRQPRLRLTDAFGGVAEAVDVGDEDFDN